MRESSFPQKHPGGGNKRLRNNRWLIALLLVVTLGALFAAWKMYGHLQDTIALAEKRIDEAEKAEQKATQQTKEARNTRDTVYVKTLRYEIAAQEALVATQKAEAAEKQADARIRHARRDKKKAEQTLDDAVFADMEVQLAMYNLEEASARLADLYLEQSRLYVAQLAYDEALLYTREAATLGVSKAVVRESLLEFVYLHAETGDWNTAWNLLDTVYTLAGDSLKRGKNDREAVREAIRFNNQAAFEKLEKRYFPKMITIPGGADTLGGIDPTPLLPVEIAYFQMAETETTWWQYGLYCKVKGVPLPAKPTGAVEVGNYPVTSINWYEAVAFTNWLNERFGLKNPMEGYPGRDGSYRYDTTEQGYRLPTECEWEYGARARTRTSFAGSDTLGQVGWSLENSKGKTQPVKQLRPNGFGLYDMSGNAWEWCWDWGEAYPQEPQKNYIGPKNGTERVFRGGSSFFKAEYARVAARFDDAPGSRFDAFGFRVAR